MSTGPFPAPSVVAQSLEVDSGATPTFPLPLTGVVVDDIIIAFVAIHWYDEGDVVSIDVPANWVERGSAGVTGGGGVVSLRAFVANYDGIITDLVVTVDGPCDAAIAAFNVIDAHNIDDEADAQYDDDNSVFASADHRYWGPSVIQPHDPVRHRVFAAWGGANDNAGDVGAADGPPADGYGLFHGTESVDAKLFVTSKATGLADIDPVAFGTGSPTVGGIGAWLTATAGGGWQWAAFGSPENDPGGTNTPPANQLFFMDCGLLLAVHYHSYNVDVEEDVPYWGMLCTPAEP